MSDAGAMLGTGSVHASRGHKAELRARRRRFLRLGALVLGLSLTLLLLNWLVFPAPYEDPNVRSSHSTRADGFLGIYRLLTELRAAPRRHAQPYTSLPDPESHALLLLAPRPLAFASTDAQGISTEQQFKALRDWVAEGGILFATPSARETFSIQGFEFGSPAELPSITDRVCEGLPSLRPAPLQGELRGTGPLRGLRQTLPSASAEWDAPLSAFRLDETAQDESGTLKVPVFAEDESAWDPILYLNDAPILLHRRYEAGHMFVMSSSLYFSNAAIARLGTARAAVYSAALATQRLERTLIFDEFSHGFWRQRGLFGWLTERKLAYPLGGLLAFLLFVVWRGSARLLPKTPPRVIPRRAKEEYVIGLAELVRRAGRTRAAAQWLYEHFEQRMQHVSDREGIEARRAIAERWQQRKNSKWTEAMLATWVRELDQIHEQHVERSRGRA
jgi:hypothetical protein